VIDHARVEVALGVDEVAAGAEEVPAPAVRLEAEHVVREQAVVNRVADLAREHPPEVRLRPGGVHEVRERRVGTPVAHEPWREVQVVVVEEDGRLGLGLELGEDRVREGVVHRHVALVPGVVEAAVDVRRVRQRPEIVLQEPEGRIRDDVVEPVVGRLVMWDEAQSVRRAVAGDLLDRLAARLLGHGAVLGGDRARDPRHVVMCDEAPERRHEPAPATLGDPLAVRVQRVRDRAAIRHHDQLSPIPHLGGP
jgi:hypothetical protein